jgi:hypothetical protein
MDTGLGCSSVDMICRLPAVPQRRRVRPHYCYRLLGRSARALSNTVPRAGTPDVLVRTASSPSFSNAADPGARSGCCCYCSSTRCQPPAKLALLDPRAIGFHLVHGKRAWWTAEHTHCDGLLLACVRLVSLLSRPFDRLRKANLPVNDTTGNLFVADTLNNQ